MSTDDPGSGGSNPRGCIPETALPPGVFAFADGEAICFPIPAGRKGRRAARTDANLYRPDDAGLHGHLRAGWGYALTMRGDRAAIDADDPDALRPALRDLPKTAWQRSGSRTSEHHLLNVPCLNVDVPLADPETGAEIGHVKAAEQSIVVAPGSLHPSGNRYGPLHGDEIATVDRDALADALEPFTGERGDARLRGEEPDPPASAPDGSVSASGSAGETTAADLNLGVYDVLSHASYPEGEYVEHPAHDSKTGANFKVDAGGDTWRCWRHGVTGNAGHLLALEFGHATCGDWVPGGLSTETWRDVFADAREAGYDLPDPPGKPSRPTVSLKDLPRCDSAPSTPEAER